MKPRAASLRRQSYLFFCSWADCLSLEDTLFIFVPWCLCLNGQGLGPATEATASFLGSNDPGHVVSIPTCVELYNWVRVKGRAGMSAAV